MPDRAARGHARRIQETTAAARVAAVATLAALALVTCASGAGPRAVTSHVVVGLTGNSGFTVQVDGQTIPESPVVSSDLGIVSFSVDDSGL